MTMSKKLLARKLWEQQVVYYKKIRRYDPDFDINYEEISEDARIGFEFFAEWVLKNKDEIYGIRSSA